MEQKQEVMIYYMARAIIVMITNKRCTITPPNTLTFSNDDNAKGRFNTAVHYFIKNLNTYIIIVH